MQRRGTCGHRAHLGWLVAGCVRSCRSLWNCGLEGTLDATSLCQLRSLHVLALNQNNLRGLVPSCITGLPISLLWL